MLENNFLRFLYVCRWSQDFTKTAFTLSKAPGSYTDLAVLVSSKGSAINIVKYVVRDGILFIPSIQMYFHW